MDYNVEKWLKDRGYQTSVSDGAVSVTDGDGKQYALDTSGFSSSESGLYASGDTLRTALGKSGAGAPKGYTPLRNTLAAQGVTVGYDKTADAPIVNGQMLNKNDSRLLKIGDDYWIEENYARSFVPETYENPYRKETENLLSELADMHFAYNPNQDTALKAAQEEAMLSAKQSANARGLLGGSTAEIMRQRAAQDLVPVYEQMAYNRFLDERNAKTERLTLLGSLAENAFSEYEAEMKLKNENRDFAQRVQEAADAESYRKDSLALENEKWQGEKSLEEQKLVQNEKQNSFKNQLSKVLAMGTVDKAASEILGLPEGAMTAEQMNFIATLNRLMQEMEQEMILADKKYENEENDRAFEKEKIGLGTDAKIRINQAK